jgi:hypothetical protein
VTSFCIIIVAGDLISLGLRHKSARNTAILGDCEIARSECCNIAGDWNGTRENERMDKPFLSMHSRSAAQSPGRKGKAVKQSHKQQKLSGNGTFGGHGAMDQPTQNWDSMLKWKLDDSLSKPSLMTNDE